MFHSERIGILCRHPCWSLWLEQRTTGWHFGRSEGDSKSLSAGYVPTDLLMQRTSRPVSGWFCWSVPRGAQRHPWIGCRSQHRRIRPLRTKVRWGCPPRVLSPPPHRTQSWWPCLPGQLWASGWRSTDRPVPSPRGWMIRFSERVAAHNGALLWCLSSRRCMRSWRSRGWPLSRPEAARPTSSILTTLNGGAARG